MEVLFQLPGGVLDVVEKRFTLNSNGIDNFDRRYSNLNLNGNYKCSNISSLVQSDTKSTKHDKTFGRQAAVRRDHNKVTVKNTFSVANTPKVFNFFWHKTQILKNERSEKYRRTAAIIYLSVSTDNFEKRKTLQSKIVEHCSKNLTPVSKYDEAEEKVKNRWKKESSSAASSALSLHIAAYENSVEGFTNAIDKNEGFKKKCLVEKWKTVKQIFTESLQSLIQNPFEFPRQQKEGQVDDPEVMQFIASQRLLNPNQSTSSTSFPQPSPGLCYNLPLAKFQFDKNAVFIGIHVDMPSKISDDDKTSKYATIGLSLNNSGGSFLKQSGNFFVQSLEHDQIETVIEEIIKEVLNRFDKNFRPSRIIVYRSGSGSEDEIQNLLMKEVSVIRRAVSHFHLDIPVTFIISTKANYLQFFNANEDFKSPQGELRSGMVIDSSITHPKIDEFYLQASVNSESNFEPTKFSIVYTDEKNASMSLFEAWTFGLCWNSQNNCSSLNVPSILSSAQKYSQFGRVFLKSFFDQGESFNFEESYKARNSKLNYSKIQTLLNKNLVA